jgi:hypothetical protein
MGKTTIAWDASRQLVARLLPLIVSADAWVWVARPEGSERAVPTLRVRGVDELVRVLLIA